MKAVTVAPRRPVRPSEYTVPVTGTTQVVVDLECDTCGSQQIMAPIAMLALLCGFHLPCPICFADSSTRVVRDVDVSDLC